jgi:drug/metabolite transporter (DMT)-like permease
MGDEEEDDAEEGLTGRAAAAAAAAAISATDFSSMGRRALRGGFPEEELSPFLMPLLSLLLLLFLFLADFLVVVDGGGRKASARGASISKSLSSMYMWSDGEMMGGRTL